jgi:LacI family transcriptional regulator
LTYLNIAPTVAGMARPTVIDIAKAAGVSLATVDRVMNSRSGVRSQTVSKVNKAIDRLGYVRDVSAANLARQRHYKLVFVLPEGPGEFVRSLRDAIEEAGREPASDRTGVSVLTVPPFDPHALSDTLNSLDYKMIDGVAIMAPETPHVRDSIRRLKEGGVPVVALVSDLPNSGRDHFAGIDNVAAGRTAAVLMGRFVGNIPARILVVAGSMLARDNVERRLGFDQVTGARFPLMQILPSIEAHDDARNVARLLDEALDSFEGVMGIYSLSAGNKGIVSILERRGIAGKVVVIAHELTESTRNALTSGNFDAVISQNIGHVVRSAVRVLKAKSDGVPTNSSQERIRIDILIKENLL